MLSIVHRELLAVAQRESHEPFGGVSDRLVMGRAKRGQRADTGLNELFTSRLEVGFIKGRIGWRPLTLTIALALRRHDDRAPAYGPRHDGNHRAEEVATIAS